MVRRLAAPALAALAAALVACAGCRDAPPRPAKATPSALAATAMPSFRARIPLPPSAASALPQPGPSVTAALQASGNTCQTTLGPVQLAFTGPITFAPGARSGAAPLILVNREGTPQVVTLPASKTGKAERLALAEAPEHATQPACALASPWIFCADPSGSIHRSGIPGTDVGPPKVVAQARAGVPIAASRIGATRVAYAFLADRKTTEGATTLAFVGVDDATPVVLSEEGSGATFVSLAPRGEAVVAMYIDARRVLTPVHARVLTAEDSLILGRDAVVFVGSGTTGRTPAAFAQDPLGFEHFLLPIDKDERTYGMAAIRIEAEPRDDAEAVWSSYPAASERPVIAATQGASPVHVLRTRPADADPKSKTLLELGQLDQAAAWKPLCTVAEGERFSDLALHVDATGALWIAYTQGDATWIERRGK